MEFFPTVSCGWPSYRFVHEGMQVDMAPLVGGRILSLQYHGQELFYQHPPSFGKKFLLEDSSQTFQELKKQLHFPLIGGDVAWVSPENQWLYQAPPIDLDLGHYLMELTSEGCILTSPVCRETGLQIVREIIFNAQGFDIIDEFFNRTDAVVEKGIWAVLAIPRPFDVQMVLDPQQWRSYHLEDPSLPAFHMDWLQKGKFQQMSVHGNQVFKCGGFVQEGKCRIIQLHQDQKYAMEWSFDMALQKEAYAHHATVEIFNSGLFSYGEIEVHAPLQKIFPQKSVSLKRSLKIFFPYIDNL